MCQTNFTVASLKKGEGFLPDLDQNEWSIGSRLRLVDENILSHVKAIQLRKGRVQDSLRPSRPSLASRQSYGLP